MLGEVRANAPDELAVAVRGKSRTAANLVRRGHATLLYMHRGLTASVQARVGRGHVCEFDPERQVFPLRVVQVRIDRPDPAEGDVELLTGPTFAGPDADMLFSEPLFAELGTVHDVDEPGGKSAPAPARPRSRSGRSRK